MNRSVRWILFSVTTSTVLVAGVAIYTAQRTRKMTHTSPVKAIPRIQFTRTHVDLAETPVSKSVTAQFPFINRGNGILNVSELQTSCSCAGAKITTDRLAPGRGAEIHMTVRPDSVRRGSAAVTVFCNDPLQRRTELVVTWNAVAPLAVDPNELHFGDVEIGRTYRQRIKILHSSVPGIAATIKSLRGEPVAIISAEEIKPESGGELEVLLSPQAEPLKDGGYVFVEVAGDWTGTLSVPVFWHTLRDLQILPEAIFFGSGDPHAEFQAQLTLVSRRDHPPSLVAVTSEPALDSFEWSLERQDARTSIVAIAGRFPAESGLHRGELALSLDDGQLLDHRLTWRCVVRQPGNVSADSEVPRDAAE